MNDSEFYYYYGRIGYVIADMEGKLMEFKARNRDLDLTKSETNINYLKQVQTRFHSLWHENFKQLKSTGDELLERERLLNKINSLEREIKNLKENIIL